MEQKIDKIEAQIVEHIKSDMQALTNNMALYDNMRGAWAYRRSKELYLALGRVLATINKTNHIK